MMDKFIAFIIYSYLGATLEHMSYYISPKEKLLANPIITGFPLYGLGAFLIIYLQQSNVVTSFLVYGFVLSFIEYMVGLHVGAGTRRKSGEIESWDYTGEPFNIRGIISLRHFITWGTLGLIVAKIHPKLIKLINYGIKKS